MLHSEQYKSLSEKYEIFLGKLEKLTEKNDALLKEHVTLLVQHEELSENHRRLTAFTLHKVQYQIMLEAVTFQLPGYASKININEEQSKNSCRCQWI